MLPDNNKVERYRLADLADLRRLTRMNQHLIEDERDTQVTSPQQIEQNFIDWLDNPIYTITLAITPNTKRHESLAYAVCRDDNEFTYLRHFFVSRTARRQGVGQRFIHELSKQISPEKPLRLNVLHQNTDAQQILCRQRISGLWLHSHNDDLTKT